MLSFAHARAGFIVPWEPVVVWEPVLWELCDACAMSVTHYENGVPFWPATCFLLSPWQSRP